MFKPQVFCNPGFYQFYIDKGYYILKVLAGGGSGANSLNIKGIGGVGYSSIYKEKLEYLPEQELLIFVGKGGKYPKIFDRDKIVYNKYIEGNSGEDSYIYYKAFKSGYVWKEDEIYTEKCFLDIDTILYDKNGEVNKNWKVVVVNNDSVIFKNIIDNTLIQIYNKNAIQANIILPCKIISNGGFGGFGGKYLVKNPKDIPLSIKITGKDWYNNPSFYGEGGNIGEDGKPGWVFITRLFKCTCIEDMNNIVKFNNIIKNGTCSNISIEDNGEIING